MRPDEPVGLQYQESASNPAGDFQTLKGECRPCVHVGVALCNSAVNLTDVCLKCAVVVSKSDPELQQIVSSQSDVSKNQSVNRMIN